MKENEALSPEYVAKTVAETMYRKDTAAQHLGIALKEIGPGYAVMTMRAVDTMLNGHNICHGGYVFTLADTAFAYACKELQNDPDFFIAFDKKCNDSYLEQGYRTGDKGSVEGGFEYFDDLQFYFV